MPAMAAAITSVGKCAPARTRSMPTNVVSAAECLGSSLRGVAHEDLDAAVLRSARCRLVVGDRTLFAEALGSDAILGDAARDEVVHHRLRALLRQVHVRAGSALVVGVVLVAASSLSRAASRLALAATMSFASFVLRPCASASCALRAAT